MLADFFPMIDSVRPSVRRNARAMGGVGIRPANPPVWRRQRF